MQLKTFGGLGLEGADFRRETPLVLLVYLSLEGEKPRRHVADLFWSDKTNKTQRLNNLSRVLSDLRKYAPGTFGASRTHVRSEVGCDVLEFRRALLGGNHRRAEELYRGPFLEGHLSGWGVELEEWIDEQRRLTSQQAQEVCLVLAEQEASRRHFTDGAAWACHAHELSDVLEPGLSKRFYTLLAAADHPLAGVVQRDMADYDLEVSLSKEEAQWRLSPTFVGRERERARLRGLEQGAWAWLRGAEGMGKTSLLKSLPGTFLPARSGAPFATLEPLLSTGGDISGGARAQLLQELRWREDTWLFDDWEKMDAESRELLASLRRARPHLRVVIAGEAPPPFAVDTVLELGPLSPRALETHPGAWEKTGGLPSLVHAYLQDDALERVLETRLAAFSDEVSDVFFSLALLGAPCPILVRRALGLDAATMTSALGALLGAHLVTPAGQVRAQDTARALLASQPSRFGPLALKLARCSEPQEAFALYQQTRAFWTQADKPAIRRAYAAYANSLQQEGQAERAGAILREVPPEEDLLLAASSADNLTDQDASAEASHVIEKRFPKWWSATHVVGFLLIALFSSRGTADAVTTGGIILSTLLILAALLYLGWRLVRLRTSAVSWSGVGVAVAAGGALALATLSRSGQLESLMCLGSVATVVGTGATIGAVRGSKAGLCGSGFAALGALFAAAQLSWGMDVGLLSELDMSLLTMQLVLSVGAAFWGYVLALMIVSSLKSRGLFATG